MKKMILILVAVCYLVSLKAEVVITGTINPNAHNVNLSYTVPINGVGNVIYDPRKINFINDSVFLIKTEIKHAGFIILAVPGKVIKIYVNPDDSVYLNIVYLVDSLNKKIIFQTLKFYGPNNDGNERLNLNPSYDQFTKVVVNIFLTKYETFLAFYNASLVNLQKLLYPYDSLYAIHKIDLGFYQVVSKEIQGDFHFTLFATFNFLSKGNNLKIGDNFVLARATNVGILTQSNYETLKRMVYREFNPQDSSYQYTFQGKSFYSAYCRDLHAGNFQTSVVYDSTFLTIPKSFQFLGYMKGKLQESSWANELYLKASSEDENELNKVYQLFVKYFPLSPYRKFIEKRLAEYSDNEPDVLASKDIVFLKGSNSIEQDVNKHFGNNFVLVDLWATWCSPCIYEFKYKDRTKAFLDKNNIKLLYISIDDISQENHWKNFATKNKLLGTHILASDKMKQEISKIFYENNDILIPRYILFNKKGKIVADDLPAPSSGEKFETKILSIILNK